MKGPRRMHLAGSTRRLRFRRGAGTLLSLLALAAAALAVSPTTSLASGRKPDAHAAAKACAGDKDLNERLGGADAAYLGRFGLCVVRHERREEGLGFRLERGLSRSFGKVIHRFAASGLEREGKSRAVVAAEHRATRQLSAEFCGAGGSKGSAYLIDDTVEAASPTSIFFARQIADFLAVGGRSLAVPSTSFALVFGHGALFRDRDHRGAHLAIFAVRCR